jgi:hypothetical protein
MRHIRNKRVKKGKLHMKDQAGVRQKIWRKADNR